MKAVIISTLVSSATVCSLTFYATALYRYNIYNYIFIIISAYGIYSVSKLFKKPRFKEVTSLLVATSLIITTYCFAYYYKNDVINTNTFYTSSIEECLNYNKSNKNVTLVCVDEETNINSGQITERMIIDTLYHHINEKDFIDIEALLYKAGYFNNNDFSNLPKFTKDNSIEFKNPKEKIIEDYVIVYSPQLKNLKYDKNQYEIIDFGSFVVLNKK